MANTEAESVDDMVDASKREVINGRWMLVQLIPESQKMKSPVSSDEAEYTSMMLTRHRKKNTIHITLSPLNILPNVLFIIACCYFMVRCCCGEMVRCVVLC